MKKLNKVWSLFEEISAGTFFFAGITLIFYGVIMRYIFNEPKAWVEEVVRYIIIWGTFLGFAIALRHNQHIQVDIVYDKLSQGTKRIVDIFATTISIVFCLAYTYYGYILVENRFHSGMVSLDVGIPMWIVYLILPISGVLFLVRFVERLVSQLRGKDVNYDNPIT
ncbi:TRAP transporter small permease [Robertmurraya andreesenii]|uniref:C4-dicarboxylate transporter DctQ subunit n=1 Tax=Anoxybacillus andreesenii TaxID=1325932 RepID=A0ABT9V8N7_9BACL|nr:TRAP transporter small permease [Robertmurraya andreesenii]MDQ0157304.1 C4-dicarboxylate transporter DctQ subunit [Robertmurraya andreesenii]